MSNPNPKNLILWTFRRNENDVVNLYNYLSLLMQISTEGNFLNFGYWDKNTINPFSAQINLCKKVGNIAELTDAKHALDIGSGFSAPAFTWIRDYPQIEITCLNINMNQLRFVSRVVTQNQITQNSKNLPNLINSTATTIPIATDSCDRIISLESAQHFKPIRNFILETKRILKKDGLLVLAIPILSRPSIIDILKLGILKFTWSSEHYDFERIQNTIRSADLKIIETEFIGTNVYVPLAEYYIQNRELIKKRILAKYPGYVEEILFRSMLKMKDVSSKGIIDYVLMKCSKI